MTTDLHNKLETIISKYQQADDHIVISKLRQLLYENEFFIESETKTLSTLITENLEMLSADKPQKGLIKTGFTSLDKAIGGLLLGELIVVGGRPAMGKTAFMTSIALNIAKTSPLLYITLELSAKQITNRFMAAISNVPAHKLSQQLLEAHEWNLLDQGLKNLNELQLYVLDNRNKDIASIRLHCEKQIRENEIKVIMVDYLQLLSSDRHRRSREIEVSYVCRELKNIAREYNVCIILSSQLNRSVENRYGVEGKRPQLADLRESGAIEQDADKVLMLHRPEYYKIMEDERGNSLIGIAEVIIAKNRNGATTDIRLRFNSNIPIFQNIDMQSSFDFAPNRLKEIEGDVPF